MAQVDCSLTSWEEEIETKFDHHLHQTSFDPSARQHAVHSE